MSPPVTLPLPGAGSTEALPSGGSQAPSPIPQMSALQRQRLRRLHEAFQSHWSVPVVLPISMACLEAGRLKGPALDHYIEALEAVETLGPEASVEEMADVLECFTLHGASGLLYAAEICQLFSEQLAAEAFLRLGRRASYKGLRLAREGLSRHRSRLRAAWRAWSRAQATSATSRPEARKAQQPGMPA